MVLSERLSGCPPLVEKPLAEAAASLLAPAEELAHTSLSSLAELLSITLAEAATLLAGAFAMLHGLADFDFDTPLNPANSADDVSIQIGTCDAAPADKPVTTGDMAEAVPRKQEEIEVVYSEPIDEELEKQVK